MKDGPQPRPTKGCTDSIVRPSRECHALLILNDHRGPLTILQRRWRSPTGCQRTRCRITSLGWTCGSSLASGLRRVSPN
jgi:hypothetical protein